LPIYIHNRVAILPRNKTYSFAGFEPGSYVTQADAMTTAYRRQGAVNAMFAIYGDCDNFSQKLFGISWKTILGILRIYF
jgi:hypothetical protein